MGKYQPFRDLDDETNDALKKSIARFGVVCPVIVDGNGSIIDGHQRARIAGELGLTYSVIKRSVKNDDDAISLAYSLNADRRHLTVDERREIVADLRAQGFSLRAIAGVVNASLGTVHSDARHSGVQPEHVTGDDGKTYAGSRPPADENGEIVSPSGDNAPSGSDQSTASRSDAAGPGDDEQNEDEDDGPSTPASSPAPKVAPPPVDPVLGYRATASRFLAQVRSTLLTLDPERVIDTSDDPDHWAQFSRDVQTWCQAIDAQLEGPRLKAVK